jgi:hypothetical protein
MSAGVDVLLRRVLTVYAHVEAVALVPQVRF